MDSDTFIFSAVSGEVVFPENIVVINSSFNGKIGLSIPEAIKAGLRVDLDEKIPVYMGFSGRDRFPRIIWGHLHRASLARTSGKFYFGMGMGVYRWGFAKIFDRKLYGPGLSESNVRIDSQKFHHHPSTLVRTKLLSSLVDREHQRNKTCERSDSSDKADSVELLSDSKLAPSGLTLVGVLLIFFSRRFLAYGERLWNNKFWFPGWGLCVACGTLTFLGFSGLVAHFFYPSIRYCEGMKHDYREGDEARKRFDEGMAKLFRVCFTGWLAAPSY